MTELEKYIQSFFGVSNEDVTAISNFFTPLHLNKGDFFLKTGRLADQLAFVQSGIMREFLLVNNKEVTKWIATMGYFVVDLSGFIFQHPSRWNIQALTDAELFVIDRKDYEQINTVVPKWPTLEKLFIAKCFTILEDRIVTHLSMTAEERYQQLFQFNAALFNEVPLHYLASMLGMTAETLSRLRKKVGSSTS